MALESTLRAGLFGVDGVLIADLDHSREYTLGRSLKADIKIGQNNLYLSGIQGRIYFNREWYFEQLGRTNPTIIEELIESVDDDFRLVYRVSFDQRVTLEFFRSNSIARIDKKNIAPLRIGKTKIYMPGNLKFKEAEYGVTEFSIKDDNSEILIFSQI